MKRKLLAYLLGSIIGVVSLGLMGGYVSAQQTDDNKCGQGCENGIKLNTCFPIIGDCIPIKKGDNGETDPTNAFPKMMSALTRIAVQILLVVCFILIIVAGIMRASEGEGNAQKSKDLIKKVAITVALLGLAGVILKAINPVFFS